jgi:Ran GTPase-activating protein (RanGAP) involved in mRNA processing and transport
MNPSVICPIQNSEEALPYDFSEIEPLLSFLKENKESPVNQAFPRGTITSDGRLDLCKQALGAEGASFVAEALWNNRVIKSILLGTDSIGNAGAGKIAMLIQHNPVLETVYLGCNYIEKEGISELTQALKTNNNVKALWLKRNPVGTDGAKLIADMLRHNTSLRTLDLVNTLPGIEGLEAICKVLEDTNRTLERLYLGGNYLTSEAACLIAKVLKKNSSLKALMLSVNQFENSGASQLANALAENTSLEELGLASNGIEDAGIINILQSLINHPTLYHLDLGHSISTKVLGAKANKIAGEAIDQLKDFLQKNTSVLHFNLLGISLPKEKREEIITSLTQNQVIQYFSMNGKPSEEISKTLERNRKAAKSAIQIASDVLAIQSVYR